MENDQDLEQPTPTVKKADVNEPPQMSEPATLGNIFFEPGNVFEDMRRKPRFLLAGLLFIACFTIFQIIFIEKIGFKEMTRARIEAGKSTREMSKEAKAEMVEQQGANVFKYVTYAVTPVGLVIFIVIASLLYWGAASALGGAGRFLGAMSVWLYSSIPPTIVFTIANLIVLFLKPADEIDIVQSQGGLIKANPSFFVDATANPVLSALLSTFDLFAIWGWVLAAIGLQRVFKLSSGSSWAVVLIFAIVGVGAKVVGALLF